VDRNPCCGSGRNTPTPLDRRPSAPDNVVIPGDTVPTTWIVAAAVGAGRSAPEGILRRRLDVVGF